MTPGSQPWSRQITLVVCLMLSFAAHALFIYWLDSTRPAIRSEGSEQAAIEVAIASPSTQRAGPLSDSEAARSAADRKSASESDHKAEIESDNRAEPPEEPAERDIDEEIPAVQSQALVEKMAKTERMTAKSILKAPSRAVDTVKPEVSEKNLAPEKKPLQEVEPTALPVIEKQLPEVASESGSPALSSVVNKTAASVSGPHLFAEPPGAEIESKADLDRPIESAETSEPRYVMGSSKTPHPDYPRIARKRGWEGEVIIALTIAETGSVVEARIHESSGHGILDRRALETLKQWRLSAAPRAREEILVPVRFELR
ncbi:energy transducer TonB [Hahella ganghwensis]|uniref:energy transducer TonB n=1 Tax=Hahella ganghwensis TaxID=286420 RepID=UPI0003A7DBEE|nr:energy transducer TonB [Hahella ganghwensis]